MKSVLPNEAGIQAAAQAIRDGLAVAYPTETVYGLGVNPFLQVAVERLFELKGRKSNVPMLLIVADEAQLRSVVADISPVARAYMAAFWPGPLSLLFPKSGALSPAVLGGQEKVCVRCPDHAVARDLCRASGMAITSTSANRSGNEPIRRPADLDLDGIAVVLDGGELAPSPPSTVYDPDTDSIIREGAVSREALDEVRRRMRAML